MHIYPFKCIINIETRKGKPERRKNMNGSRTYTEQREVFGSKDQALDFIEAKRVLLISLREKNGMWCLKYLEA